MKSGQAGPAWFKYKIRAYFLFSLGMTNRLCDSGETFGKRLMVALAYQHSWLEPPFLTFDKCVAIFATHLSKVHLFNIYLYILFKLRIWLEFIVLIKKNWAGLIDTITILNGPFRALKLILGFKFSRCYFIWLNHSGSTMESRNVVRKTFN